MSIDRFLITIDDCSLLSTDFSDVMIMDEFVIHITNLHFPDNSHASATTSIRSLKNYWKTMFKTEGFCLVSLSDGPVCARNNRNSWNER